MREILKSNVSTFALVLIAGLGEAAVPAYAACTSDANHNVTCTGANTTPLTIYDQAAQFQPAAGSNAYTPANPAFPAATNPSNPGYNPNPATELVTIATGATYISPTITAANRTTALADNGLIVANYSNSENPAVNNVTLTNSGTVTLNNGQSANRASAIVSDSQVNVFTVNNNPGGTITAIQAAPTFTPFNPALLTVVTSGTPPAAAARYSGAAFGITSALYSDDNTNSFVVNNAAGASITASGHFATPYYGRADATITNSGTIGNTDWAATDTIAAGHWALTAWAGTDYNVAPNTNPDSDIVIPNANGSVTVLDTSALTVTNNASGTIKGDILALDVTPLVYAAAVAGSTNPFPNSTTQPTLLMLPVSSSNGGPRDSNIENYGTINGNFYLGSGTHVIDNAAGATTLGSVYVDQRPVQVNFSEPNAGSVTGTFLSIGGTDFNGNTCPTSGQNTTDAGCAGTTTKTATVVGGQSLTFTNEGTFTGDIRIFDQATSVNSVTLTGTGFTGNVVAVNGTGSNSLVLDGVTTLASVQNFSSVDLMQSNVTVAGGVSLVNGSNANGSTLATTIFGPGGTTAAPSMNAGSIIGTLTSVGTTTVAPTIAAPVQNGGTYELATTATGTYTAGSGTGLVSYAVSNASGPLLLTTNLRNANSVAGISQSGAQTINGLTATNSSNPNVQALQVAVENLPSDGAVAQAGKALSPVVNGADVQAPINSAVLFQQQIDSRLDQFIYGQIPSSGRSADLGVTRPVPVYGAIPTNASWIEGVGGGIHQSSVGGVAGYTAQLVGVIGGYDQTVLPNLKVGAAFGYLDGRINDNSLTANRDRIQTYQGLAYAEFAPGPYYVRGSAGYGGVNYASVRQIAFAGFNDVAYGKHDGNIFTARGEAGVPYTYGSSLLVPYAAFTYNHLTQNGYTETSGAGAALAFQGVTNDSERSEVGGKVIVPLVGAPVFSYLFPAATSVLALEARAAYVHEFGNVGQTVTTAFAGGNFFSVSGPVPNRDMVDFAVGLKMASGPVQIDLSYNGLARSTFYEQVGLLRAHYVF